MDKLGELGKVHLKSQMKLRGSWRVARLKRKVVYQLQVSTGSKIETHKVATKKRQKRAVFCCVCASAYLRGEEDVPVRGRGMCNAGTGAPCLALRCA